MTDILHSCYAIALKKICPQRDRHINTWQNSPATIDVSRTTFFNDNAPTLTRWKHYQLSQLVMKKWKYLYRLCLHPLHSLFVFFQHPCHLCFSDGFLSLPALCYFPSCLFSFLLASVHPWVFSCPKITHQCQPCSSQSLLTNPPKFTLWASNIYQNCGFGFYRVQNINSA